MCVRVQIWSMNEYLLVSVYVTSHLFKPKSIFIWSLLQAGKDAGFRPGLCFHRMRISKLGFASLGQSIST